MPTSQTIKVELTREAAMSLADVGAAWLHEGEVDGSTSPHVAVGVAQLRTALDQPEQPRCERCEGSGEIADPPHLSHDVACDMGATSPCPDCTPTDPPSQPDAGSVPDQTSADEEGWPEKLIVLCLPRAEWPDEITVAPSLSDPPSDPMHSMRLQFRLPDGEQRRYVPASRLEQAEADTARALSWARLNREEAQKAWERVEQAKKERDEIDCEAVDYREQRNEQRRRAHAAETALREAAEEFEKGANWHRRCYEKLKSEGRSSYTGGGEGAEAVLLDAAKSLRSRLASLPSEPQREAAQPSLDHVSQHMVEEGPRLHETEKEWREALEEVSVAHNDVVRQRDQWRRAALSSSRQASQAEEDRDEREKGWKREFNRRNAAEASLREAAEHFERWARNKGTGSDYGDAYAIAARHLRSRITYLRKRMEEQVYGESDLSIRRSR